MIKNVTTVQLSGQAVVWDGTNLDEVQQVAEDNFEGVSHSYVLVRSETENEVIWVRPGWTVSRLDGRVTVSSPGAASFLLAETEAAGA